MSAPPAVEDASGCGRRRPRGRESPCGTRRRSGCLRRAAIARPGASGLLREDADDLGGIVGRLGGLDQRRHVGAAAGDQDRDALRVTGASVPSKVTGSSGAVDERADDRGAARRSRRGCAISRSASSAATTASMPTPQLKVRSISRSAMPPISREPAEDRRHGDGVEVDVGGEVVGQHARDVVDEAAAGDVGEGLDADAGLERGEQRLHVDAGRGRAGPRRACVPASNGAGADQSRPEISTILRTSE